METQALNTKTLFSAENLRAVLGEMAKDMAVNYREQLQRSGRPASWNLYNSVSGRAVVDGHVWEVQLSLLEYWKYIEYGTRPHWPPVSKILEWVKVKPVIPHPDKHGRIPSQKSLAYLIARKISRFGTEGKPDLKNTVDKLLSWYMEKISEALARDAAGFVHAVFGGDAAV